jgi:hypothetical protein
MDFEATLGFLQGLRGQSISVGIVPSGPVDSAVALFDGALLTDNDLDEPSSAFFRFSGGTGAYGFFLDQTRFVEAGWEDEDETRLRIVLDALDIIVDVS